MKIAIPKERRAGEARVAASPDVIAKLIGLGFDVIVEAGAGDGASFTDDAFKAAGASIAKDATTALKSADIVLKIAAPDASEVAKMKKGTPVIVTDPSPFASVVLSPPKSPKSTTKTT